MQQLRNVVQTGSSNDVELLKMAVKMPDALKTEREELNEDEWGSTFCINCIINFLIPLALLKEEDIF